MTTEYPRGSEWRRWDLHIHTPYSYLHNEYGDPSDEKTLDQYITKLFSEAIKNKICAIGITDYFSVDGYEKVIEYKKNISKLKELQFSDEDIMKINELLILPNIELRLKCIVGTNRVNFHVIFSNEVSVRDIRENFLENLFFSYEGSPDDSDYKFKLTKYNLEQLGTKLIKEQPSFTDKTPLFIGAMNAVIDDNDISLALSKTKTFKDSYIIAVPVDEDLSKLQWTKQDHQTRKILYQKAHCFLSSNPGTIAFGLGQRHPTKSEYLNEFITYKPCIHGSDAHSYDKIFNPDENRYCWIKADPTFNGLKQILYEPEERVKISETQPEVKEDYYVIDRVKFNEKDFQTQPIYFNDKLTCIIGGKSTGKSILLQNIANHIDSQEAQKNIKKSETKTREVTNLRVFWRDGEEKDRKIIYIPQTYLNKLSDSKQEKTEIDQWIGEVLFRNDEIKKANEVYNSAIEDLSIDVNTNIINFVSKNERCIENIKSQKDIGDKQGIISTIQKLEAERLKISEMLRISEEDIKAYNTSVSNIQKANNNKMKLELDKNIILKIDSLVQNNNLDPSISELSKGKILKIQEDIINTANQKWQEAKSSIIKAIEDQIEQEKNNLQNSIAIFNQKKPLIDSSHTIVELSKRIQEEEHKKQLLEEKENLLKTIIEEKNKLLEYLCSIPMKYKEINNKYQEGINAAKIEDEDISFFAEVVFRSEALKAKLPSIYDSRNKDYKSIIDDDFSEKEYMEQLKIIIEKTMDGSLPTRSNFSKEDALREILVNWYNTTYKVKMEDDTLDVMSPGKKALVLLKVLIGLAENKCPILIDQPEDDLDNRSIYGDLVNYIKEKKKERQIIIVTHNANIVIGSDAEEVIVANQKGKNSPNKEFRFEYKSGAIENNTPTDKSKTMEDIGILNSQGIQQHICDILEGGEKAFELRKNKYHI